MRELYANLALTERALAASALISALLIAGAHFFERVIGLPPCILCLDQREAHWTALGVGLAGLAAAKLFQSRFGAAAGAGALALVYAVSAGLAFYHTGVEYGYWPGPAACSGGATITDVTDLAASLTQQNETISCADAPWRFLGASMAGYNLLISAGLFALTFFAALSESRRVKRIRLGGGAMSGKS